MNEETKQTIIVQHAERPTNGIGTAGFIIALVTLFFGWVPVFGWLMWAVGGILSFIGMFKKPAGLAIAGFIISIIDLLMIAFVFSFFTALFAI